MKIGVFHSELSFSKRQKIPTLFLKNLVKEILQKERKKYSLDVILLTDEEMIKLNKEFTKRNKTTDVLSFSLEEKGSDFLGEVYVSLDQAKRQAKEYKVSFQEELFRLVIHGVLHLLGYDHKKTKEKKLMQQKEEKYLFLIKK